MRSVMNTPIIISRAEAREIDRCAIEEYGIPSLLLMENAGRGIAEYLLNQKIKGPVVICCGKGNNGGDGFVIARHLDNKHISVQLFVFADPNDLSVDAKINYDILTHSEIPITHFTEKTLGMSDFMPSLTSAEWIIDALFGTGLLGSVKPPFDKIITAINSTNANVLAVDIPSGLDCDTGKPLGPTIKADHTVTFIAMKKGFTNLEAISYLGKTTVINIGIPRMLLERKLQ